jgi:hypothetical protein
MQRSVLRMISVPIVGAIVASVVVFVPAVGGVTSIVSRQDVVEAAGSTTRYEPLLPCRIADQRTGLGFIDIAEHTASIAIDACEIPSDARALMITTTVVRPQTTGWLLAYPSGRSAPTAATLNWSPGTTRANSAVVRVGAGGRIDVLRSDTFDSAPIFVDVVGAYVPAEAATSGRLVTPDVAQRLIDTRQSPGGRVEAGSVIRLPLPAGVPDDASALAINVTLADTAGGGFVTVWPAGAPRPEASMLNADAAGQVRAGASIVPVSREGFDVYISASAQVVVDMTGWFTGDSAELSTNGLFVPIDPIRLRDTRPESSPLYPGGAIEVRLPSDAGSGAAVAMSMTIVRPEVRGFITASPARTTRSATSSGYGMEGEVTAQFAMPASSAAGIDIYSHSGSELTADLFGWFTGPSAPTTSSTPSPNPIPLQRVIAIGDSSLAGIDRNASWAQLRGADFALLARSCRRLVRESCRGEEGPVPPPTALDTLRETPFGYYDVAVIMTGYNDTMPGVASAVPTVIDAARDAGVRRIVWLTQAREFRSDKGGPGAFQVYGGHNDAIRANAAASDDVQAFEWSALVRQSPHWVYADGIHLDRQGGSAAADFISRAVAHVTGQPCPMPQVVGGTNDGVCPDPGTMPPIDVAALYGVV